MQRILDELRRLGKKGDVWKCLENVLEFGAQALAHYLRDHSITINDMMVKDKVSGTTFVVSALPHKCIFQETSVYIQYKLYKVEELLEYVGQCSQKVKPR